MSVARERSGLPHRSSPWIAAAIAGLVLLGGFGLWAYNRTRPEAAVAARRDITPAVSLEGSVIVPPDEMASVMAPFDAPVEEVLTTVGANVNRGDVLVELSVPSTEAVFQQARQRVKAAETAYANAKQQYSVEVNAAQKELDAARAAERAARTAPAPAATPAPAPVDGGAPVSPAPSIPETAAPAADLTALSQERIAAEQRLAAAKAQMEASLVPYQQQLDAAREAFQRAQAGEKMTQVRAPISGTVLALNAQTGQTVKADDKTPVATIVDLDELEVHAPLAAEYASTVEPGKEATVVVTEVPNEQFDGRVHSVVTAPGKPLKKPGYLAILHLENEKGLIKPGMKARVAVKLGETRNVLAVPNDAIKADSTGRPVVRVLRNGDWVSTVVETGITDGQYTEIKSGLKEGDTIQVKQDLV